LIELILYILTFLISITVVGGASSAGFLNNGFTRAFGGLSTQVVSINFLYGYTNFETFIRGCLDGQVGLIGYVFILSLGFLIIVWVNNLINYRQAIM
jgi:hypothetical protein